MWRYCKVADYSRSAWSAKLIAWMDEHPTEPLTVEQLADQAAMSPRHFARAFAALDPGRMRRAFMRAFGMPPRALRRTARA